MYDNLIQFIDKVKTTVIALTQEEVKLATLRFRNRYREVYFLNHGVGKNF